MFNQKMWFLLTQNRSILKYCICKYNFNCSFQIWMPLPSFSSLISLAITSNTVLKRNGENKHLYLVTNHREKAFLLPQLLCCYLFFFGRWPLLDWGCSFLFLFCVAFYYGESMDFVKYFSCIYWNYHTVIVLLLVCCITLIYG